MSVVGTARLFAPVYVLVAWAVLAIAKVDYPTALFVVLIAVAAVLHGVELVHMHVVRHDRRFR